MLVAGRVPTFGKVNIQSFHGSSFGPLFDGR